MNQLEWLNFTGIWWASIVLWVLLLVAVVLVIRSWALIHSFFTEVKVELAKASWPWDPKEKGMKKYKELTDSTLIVVIAMLLLSGYVAGWDFVLHMIMGFIFKAPAQ